MVEPTFTSRRALLRIYHALCCVCAAPGGASPERIEALTRHRDRLELTRAESSAIERAARSPGSVRVGNSAPERSYLSEALNELAQAGPPPRGQALAILRRLARQVRSERGPRPIVLGPRPGPFETSDVGTAPAFVARAS